MEPLVGLLLSMLNFLAQKDPLALRGLACIFEAQHEYTCVSAFATKKKLAYKDNKTHFVCKCVVMCSHYLSSRICSSFPPIIKLGMGRILEWNMIDYSPYLNTP